MMNYLLYIDPGSGSLVLQILAGSALAASLFVKTYWCRIESVFEKDNSREENGG